MLYALHTMFQIETDRLVMRVYREEDVTVAQKLIYGDAEVMTYLDDGVTRPIERTEKTLRFFIKHQQEHGFSIWAVANKATGEVIGQCGLCILGDTGDVEVAYAFGKKYWGQGYATEAARASLRFAFEQARLHGVVALAYPPNIASQNVMRKLGMTHEGITTRYGGTPLEFYKITREAFDPGNAFYKATLERSA